jgi:PAS domain S-box-containing protein
MVDLSPVEPLGSFGPQRLLENLLSTYIRDPLAPKSEEVHRLASELANHQVELEAEIQKHRDAKRHLEAYRDRYIDLYDFAPLGYATLDQDGYVQEINLAGAKMFGVERDALIGYAFGEYVAGEDQQVFLDHLHKCAEEHSECTSELHLLTKDNRSLVVQLNSIPIEGPKEDILCKTAITDVTQRKNMEESLAQERNLLRTLIDNLLDYIYVKDAQGRFVAANLATAQIMGAASPNDLLGKTDYDFYPRKLADKYRADEERIISSGEPLINKDEPHMDSNGNSRTIMTTKVPLTDNRGKVVGLVGLGHDITERRQTDKALRLTQFSMDRAGEAIFWVGSDSRFTYANATACKLLGYSREELQSMIVHDVNPNCHPEGWPQYWQKLKQQGSLTYQCQLYTKVGQPVPVEINSNFLEFEGSEYNCSFVRCLTEHKQTEEEIYSVQEPARI